MKKTTNFLAIDLGASGGRVVNGMWDGGKFELREVRRFGNAAVSVPGGLYWDVLHLWSEIRDGMACYSQEHNTSLASIGLDTWGVDFALVDKRGRLISNPYSYRDHRTLGMPEALYQCIPKEELFCLTGTQPSRINTIFQLYSLVRESDPQMRLAETLLMLPDLFSYWMTGEKRAELTEAATSGMLCVANRAWAPTLLARTGIPASIFPQLVDPGTVLGPLKRKMAEEAAFDAAPAVVAVGTHDTASAVAGIPGMDRESVFISCGTWSLIGVKVDAPITTAEALSLSFTNEIAGCGKVLFLRNLTGLWLLQECMRSWEREALHYSWGDLMRLAEEAVPFRTLIDPDAAEFLAPGDMVAAIQGFAKRTGQPIPESPAAVARCCLESLSLSHRQVLESLEKTTRRRLTTIRIVGGGSRNRLLCQWTADACGCGVVAGPAEASALGNVLVQAVATGHLAHIEDGWHSIEASSEQRVYESHAPDRWEEPFERFRSLAR